MKKLEKIAISTLAAGVLVVGTCNSIKIAIKKAERNEWSELYMTVLLRADELGDWDNTFSSNEVASIYTTLGLEPRNIYCIDLSTDQFRDYLSKNVPEKVKQ